MIVARPSVYEFTGGDEAFLALAAAHHERCLADPVLNHPVSHPGDPNHIEHLAAYWAEVFGGPRRYSESLGGQSFALRLHAGTDAEEDLARRFIDCFVHAADDAGLPADPEFRKVLRDYMEWAVAQVMAVSPHGSVVAESLPFPCWSWEGRVDPNDVGPEQPSR